MDDREYEERFGEETNELLTKLKALIDQTPTHVAVSAVTEFFYVTIAVATVAEGRTIEHVLDFLRQTHDTYTNGVIQEKFEQILANKKQGMN